MKKGMVFPEIIGLIIVLVIAGILTFFIIQYKIAAMGAADIEKCRLSIILASKAKVAGESLTKLDCPRNNIKFEKESQEEINAKVAKELYNCVYKSGSGEYDWTSNPWIGVNANKNVCMICSTIEFDPKYIKDKNYQPYNPEATFERFLSKGIIKGVQLSYSDYFSAINNKDVPNDRKMDITYMPALEPDKSYAIYFTRISETLQAKILRNLGDDANFKITKFMTVPPAVLFGAMTGNPLPLTVAATAPDLATTSAVNIPLSYVFLAPINTVSTCDVVMN